MERTAQILAVYCLIVVAVMAGRPSFTSASQPVRGISDPVIALQTARTIDDVDAILSDAPSPDREVMRLKQYIDFGLIAGYVALAWVLGQIMIGQVRPGGRGNSVRVMQVLALAAGLQDVREDLGILRIVHLNLGQITSGMLDALRLDSFIKWGLLAAATALLALLMMPNRHKYVRSAVVVNFLGAGLAVLGIFRNELLVWAGVLMAAGLLLTAATLKWLTHESTT